MMDSVVYWLWPLKDGVIDEVTRLQCGWCGSLYFWLRPLDGVSVRGNCHPFYTNVYLDQVRRVIA